MVMADMIFKYSAMNGGKTINILQTAFSYEDNNFKIVIIKSIKDTKGKDTIISRNGMNRKVDILLKEDESLLTTNNYKKYYTAKCILVDEVELLNETQVKELWTIAHLINIPVICYGLKSNFKGELFSDGIASLFAISDHIEEIGSTSICLCGKKAIFNARKENDKFTDIGPNILIDDGSKKEIEYVPLCSDCFLKYVKIGSEEAKKLANLVDKIK
jgi:thymidine kinase